MYGSNFCEFGLSRSATLCRHPVQCAVGSSVFQYAFVGSNPYYIKLQITNTRCAAGVCTALFFSPS